MGRRLRVILEKETLVAITCRTVQGRFLFRPSPEFNDLALGVLGRAQRLYPVRVCGVSVLSNHIHLLLIVQDALQVARFMQHLGSNLAREVNRLNGWSGPVFQSRYSMIPVTGEEAAQVERFKYLLAQGCKEHLVERPGDWPGIQCVTALLDGVPLTGHWWSRTEEHREGSGRGLDPERFATRETLHLSPLPCWEHLPEEAYRQRVTALVEEIEQEAAAERLRNGGIGVLGCEAILARDPRHLPEPLARSRAPLVHAATQAARQTFLRAYASFVAAFRSAAEKLRSGDRNAPFPAGCFPPALPFVPG